MKNKSISISAAILAISIAGYFLTIYDGNIRTVEFIAIFAIGILSGILLTQLPGKMSSKPTS